MITREQFEKIIAEEFPNAIPERFRPIIKNVAFLAEDEPDEGTRREEDLRQNETLLGLYRGVPAIARGDLYGVGAVLPDSITLYQLPIEEEAAFLCKGDASKFEASVRRVVRETVWHEVAHHFGFGERDVRRKERERRNAGNHPQQAPFRGKIGSMEKPKLAPYVLMALSFIGLADTLFLSMKQFLGQTPGCFLLTGCDTVLHSAYSKFYGVPLSNIGLVFYLYMLALAILLAVDSYSKGLRFGVLVYALIGLLCSIAFEALQAFVIHALCIYCAISALVTLLLFITAIAHMRSARPRFENDGARA